MKCSFRGERTIGKIKDRNSIFWKFNQNWRDEESRRKKNSKAYFLSMTRNISLSLDSRSPLKKKMISCVDDVYWKYGDRKSLENGPKGRIFFLPPGDIIARLNNNNNISSSFSYLAFTRRFCSCSASSWFLRIFSEKRSSI